jgi:hypothetical protein
VLRAPDLLTVERHDDVTGLHAGFRRRTSVTNVIDERTGRRRQLAPRSLSLVDVANRHADLAA